MGRLLVVDSLVGGDSSSYEMVATSVVKDMFLQCAESTVPKRLPSFVFEFCSYANFCNSPCR